jgi:tRNA-2-methylthio-N6-dimethylallyladenosine synthase
MKNDRNDKIFCDTKKSCFYIRTFGCQMNVRDSEVVSGLLKRSDYKMVDELEKADIIIFNTCSVRQHAEDKVWSEIGRIAKLRTKFGVRRTEHVDRPRTSCPVLRTPIIGLIGCMAQNYKEVAFDRAPAIDFVVGPSDIDKIPRIIKDLLSSRHQAPDTKFQAKSLFERRIWETDGASRPEEIYHTGFYEDKEHAYVVISEGCSNYCSYCVVPYVRGNIRHRHYKDITKEIEEAIKKGLTKITLLGQNVNAYTSSSKFQASCLTGRQASSSPDVTKINFIELLNMVNNIKDLKEFDFITSHPKDTNTELFKAMAGLDKLKKCLHLPVQSGSNRILQMMNRGYTRELYLDLIQNYRKIVKGGLLSTDVIVGFPTETVEDFHETFDLVKESRFNSAYIFKYSHRPGTQAADLLDDVLREEKERRHKLILDLQKEISKKIQKK